MGSTMSESVTPGRALSAQPGVWLTDISLVLMALIWGVNFSVVKYGTGLVNPLAYNGVRVSLAALLLLAITSFDRVNRPSRRDALLLLALGVLGNGIYQYFFVVGISQTRASDAALVVAASPAFIAIIGRVFGTEHVARKGVVGIALSVAGIALVVLGTSQGDAGQSSLIGDLLVLAGSLAWAVYTVLLKPFTNRVNGLQLSAFTMLGGALSLLIVALPKMVSAPWRTLPTAGWLAIGYSGVFALVVAYYFWYRGVRILGPTRTAMYSNLQPVIAVLVAWAMLGETPTVWQVVGAGSIMGGLLLTRA
jgi:drug/metabolite transporter (DMT)-like permease